MKSRLIIALTSSVSGGCVSRIVPRLVKGIATVRRGDTGIVGTWGMADLRHFELAQRLVATVAPRFCDALACAVIGPGNCETQQ